MAGSKLIETTRLKASSILEVVIAMVVIVVVFTIAMAIFGNVQRLSLTGKKVKAQAVLKQVLLKSEQNVAVGKETTTIDEFKVEQEITLYGQGNNLYQISQTAYDSNGEIVAESKNVIYEAR